MTHNPLESIRILEIGAYISAPYAGSLMAALGAEVVKIEPLGGEAFRRGQGVDSHYFVQYNIGKKSVAVDLKSPQGVELIKSLLPRFDVVIQNMRPGKLEALGLGDQVCREINPRLIFASVSGFGSGGPLVQRPAYDTIGQSYGGIYSMMNEPGSPRLTGTCMADLITGVSIGMGILAALIGRGTDKPGALVETSLMEAISLLTIDAMTQAHEQSISPTRESRHPQAQNFCLNTAEGGALTLHLSSSEKFWASLMRAVGLEQMLDDARFRRYSDRMQPENYAALLKILEGEFLKCSRTHWESVLSTADVPFAPVLSLTEVAQHPQTQWLELIGQAPSGQTLILPPWRFDGRRPARNHTAPHIGEHTQEILREVCSEDQLQALLASHVVAAASA